MVLPKESNADNYYIPPPQLPGVVYRFPSFPPHCNLDRRMIIFLCVLGVIGFVELVATDPDMAVVIVILFMLGFFQIYYKSCETQLTPDYAIIKYGIRKRKQETVVLQDYFVSVNKAKRGYLYSGKNYAYCIWLIPKNILDTEIKDGSVFPEDFKKSKSFSAQVKVFQGRKDMRKKGGIRISPDMYSPDNVKKYVDSIQSQINGSLLVVFGSEQVALDYVTGTSQAKCTILK
ncbi:MAG: hypothetical protein KAJ40_00720 [Alphaproteobacteria bacterium]|nr:hypothetical protein [Alphaproteobacteria bacterium]